MDKYVLSLVFALLGQEFSLNGSPDPAHLFRYSLVCKLWKELVAKELSWATISTIAFRTTVDSGSLNISGSVRQITLDPSGAYAILTHNHQTAYPLVAMNEAPIQKFMQFLDAKELSYSGLWRNTVSRVRIGGNYMKVTITWQINITVLKSLVANNISLASSSTVWDSIDEAFRVNPSHLPVLRDAKKSTILDPIEQPQGFVADFRLSSFQLSSLAWLMHMEHKEHKLDTYSKLVPWHMYAGHVYYDKANTCVPSLSQVEAVKTVRSIKGGIFADERGLGRKVTLTALILATRGTVPTKQLDMPNATPIKASLILCEQPHIEKWYTQILQNTEPKLNVLVCADMDYLAKCAKSDIVNADVVILEIKYASAPPTRIYEFIWQRVIYWEAVIYKIFDFIAEQKMNNIEAGYSWCATSHLPNREFLRVSMALLGFPETQCLFELYNCFVWRSILPRIKYKTVFERDTIAADISNMEFYFENLAQDIRWENSESLDESKATALHRSQEKISRTLTIQLSANLVHEFACIFNATEVYKGPPSSIESLLQDATDSVLAQQILESNDKDDTEYIFRREEIQASYSITANRNRDEPKSESAIKSPRAMLSFFKSRRSQKVLEPQKEQSRTLTKAETLAFITNKYGAKVAHFILHVMEVWKRDPCARVLVYANPETVSRIFALLNNVGISCGKITGHAGTRLNVSVGSKTRKDFPIRVLLLSGYAPPNVTIAVSHIYLLAFSRPDFANADLIEDRSLDGLFSVTIPQGNRKSVYVMRIFWKYDKIDFDTRMVLDLSNSGDIGKRLAARGITQEGQKVHLKTYLKSISSRESMRLLNEIEARQRRYMAR